MKQRSAKKIRKWKEKFERERELRQEIRAAAPDILRSRMEILFWRQILYPAI